MGERKKVLILPGGGAFGWIQILFLCYLGIDDITKYVDAIGGCSIGGILALILGLKTAPMKLKEQFKINVLKIFANPSLLRKMNPYSSKYPAENIEPVLKEMMPGFFSDIKIPIVIQSTNFQLNQPKVFDNMTNDDLSTPTWNIGRATSAAPYYFPPFSEDVLIDGGLTENIPIFTTVYALKAKLGWQFEDMDVFVIGTGWKYNTPKTLKDVTSYTLIDWAKNLLLNFCTTNDNEAATDYWARQAGFRSYTYFNPIQITEDMDDTSIVTSGKYDEKCAKWKDMFISEWNQFMSGDNKNIARSLSRGKSHVTKS